MKDDRFRSRVFQETMEKGLRRFPAIDSDGLFGEILGNDDALGGRFVNFLQNLSRSNKRQGLRFLEVCCREDDPERWAGFLEHERERASSSWREKEDPAEDVVKRFADALPKWWKSVDSGSFVNQKFRDSLACLQQSSTELNKIEPLLGGFEPTGDEYKKWRLMLLRQVIRRITRGETA